MARCCICRRFRHPTLPLWFFWGRWLLVSNSNRVFTRTKWPPAGSGRKGGAKLQNEMETGQQIQFESRQGAQLVAAHLACLICQLAACHRNTQNVTDSERPVRPSATLPPQMPTERREKGTNLLLTDAQSCFGCWAPSVAISLLLASERPTTFRSRSSRWPHLVGCFNGQIECFQHSSLRSGRI